MQPREGSLSLVVLQRRGSAYSLGASRGVRAQSGEGRLTIAKPEGQKSHSFREAQKADRRLCGRSPEAAAPLQSIRILA